MKSSLGPKIAALGHNLLIFLALPSINVFLILFMTWSNSVSLSAKGNFCRKKFSICINIASLLGPQKMKNCIELNDLT